MLKTLGIHSSAAGTVAFTAGHAWLTLHFANGNSTSVGLWTSTLAEPRRFVRDPTGFALGETLDVEWGLEISKQYRAAASRYYGLTPGQAKHATSALIASASWRFTNTCATWATEVVRRLAGEELDSTELLGATNTPRALGNAILALEAKSPTSLGHPRPVVFRPIGARETSSSTSSPR